MAPPLEADYGNWNDVQRYAFNRNRRGADGTEPNIHATNWFQIAGSLLNPARAEGPHKRLTPIKQYSHIIRAMQSTNSCGSTRI